MSKELWKDLRDVLDKHGVQVAVVKNSCGSYVIELYDMNQGMVLSDTYRYIDAQTCDKMLGVFLGERE